MMIMRTFLKRNLIFVMFFSLFSCNPPDDPPREITVDINANIFTEEQCDHFPDELKARAWFSGFATPCELGQLTEAHTITGTCDKITNRATRKVTISVFSYNAEKDHDLVLLQAEKMLDLSSVNDSVSLTFAPSDFHDDSCVNPRATDPDTGEGETTDNIVNENGVVCNVDDDQYSNFNELCSLNDPYVPN